MSNFIELNIEGSVTSLKFVDTDLRVFRIDKDNVTIYPCRKCDICGVPESIVKLYDGLCKDCAKHYIY